MTSAQIVNERDKPVPLSEGFNSRLVIDRAEGEEGGGGKQRRDHCCRCEKVRPQNIYTSYLHV